MSPLNTGGLRQIGSPKSDILTGAGITGGHLPESDNIEYYYHYTTGSGSTLEDGSGNDRDATVNGASWAGGYSSEGSLSYDGGDDYTDIPDSNSPSYSSAYTVCMLMYIPGTVGDENDNQEVWDMRANSGIFMQEDTGGNLEYNHGHSGGRASVEYTPSTGKWWLMTQRWDGSTLEAFDNDTSVGTASVSNSPTQESYTNVLGRRPSSLGGGDQYWDGDQSLFVVWDGVALSDTEIQDLASDLDLI